MTTILHQTLSHSSLHPPNLGILRGKKSWLLNLDIVVLSDRGNVYDALFMAARAALWDTKVPRTKSVEYKARNGPAIVSGSAGESGDIDLESSFDTRQIQNATDFELPDYWDEGEILGGRDRWPICVTMNLVRLLYIICYDLLNVWTGASHTLSGCNNRGGVFNRSPTIACVFFFAFIYS